MLPGVNDFRLLPSGPPSDEHLDEQHDEGNDRQDDQDQLSPDRDLHTDRVRQVHQHGDDQRPDPPIDLDVHVALEERSRPQASDERDARAGKRDRGNVVDAGAERSGSLAERVSDELVDRAGSAVALGELAERPADAEHADGRQRE